MFTVRFSPTWEMIRLNGGDPFAGEIIKNGLSIAMFDYQSLGKL